MARLSNKPAPSWVQLLAFSEAWIAGAGSTGCFVQKIAMFPGRINRATSDLLGVRLRAEISTSRENK